MGKSILVGLGKTIFSVVILFVFVTAYNEYAEAAGFAIVEQSVSGLGNAYAGGSAGAEDATTLFFNPAGITRLKNAQLILAGHVIIPEAKFKNQGSTHVLQGITGIGLLGNNGGDGGVTVYVPNFYYARAITEKIYLGFAVNSPFGLATEYDKDWVGRYHAIKSEMLTININPSVAYKVTDRLSVAAGFNLQYLKAELSSAIDFGTLDATGYFAPTLPAGALGLTPQLSDGYVTLKGDSWGYGFNIGLLYELSNKTRFGLSYRSRITHRVKGDADFSNVPSGLSLLPVFKDTNASIKITLPDTLSVGFYHLLTPEIAIMGDVTLTRWSVLDELRFHFDNPNQPDSVTTTRWDDSFRYSLGLSYYASKALTIRTGIAYDETPIQEARYRTPRIPDGDRLWLAAGVGYTISRDFTVDLGYAHLFVNDPEINKNPTGENALKGGLKGTYDANVNIISAQVTWRF